MGNAPRLQVYRSPGKCGGQVKSRVLPGVSSDVRAQRCHHSITSISPDKSSAGTPSVCTHWEVTWAFISSKKKKKFLFIFPLSLGMMGAVVPWAELREAEPFLSSACSLWPWGERKVEQQLSTFR